MIPNQIGRTAMTATDLLDDLVDIHGGAPPTKIRPQRVLIMQGIQASYEALLQPNEFSNSKTVMVGASPCGRPQGDAPTITELGCQNSSEASALSSLERALIAYRVAILTNSAPLIEHYRGQLRRLGATVALVDAAERLPLDEPLPPRIVMLLQQADRLTSEPQTATRAHLTTLQAEGLSLPDLLTLTQLVAFLNFQARTLAGLQMLAEGV